MPDTRSLRRNVLWERLNSCKTLQPRIVILDRVQHHWWARSHLLCGQRDKPLCNISFWGQPKPGVLTPLPPLPVHPPSPAAPRPRNVPQLVPDPSPPRARRPDAGSPLPLAYNTANATSNAVKCAGWIAGRGKAATGPGWVSGLELGSHVEKSQRPLQGHAPQAGGYCRRRHSR